MNILNKIINQKLKIREFIYLKKILSEFYSAKSSYLLLYLSEPY